MVDDRMVKMNSIRSCKQLLIDNLASKGLKDEIIPSVIRSMRICYASDPQMNSLKTNRLIHSLGWNDIDLDYQTLKLSVACFEAEIKITNGIHPQAI